MQADDHGGGDPATFARVLARPTPAPPPPMPSAAPAPPPPPAAGTATTQAAEVRPAGPPKSWQIDPDQLSAFKHAVESVRDQLRDVQAKVERMRTESFTPRLGTSPAGTQLEAKFAARLDSPVDDPKNPMFGGLRPMLGVAMRRMEEFVAGAEAAVKAYQDMDHTAATRATTTNS
jgi:hypothetical protein